MNKKSKVKIEFFEKKISSYNQQQKRIFWLLPELQKIIKLVAKQGKKEVATKLLFNLLGYWKQKYKREFIYDLVLILNYYIWPIILLKVKKGGKIVELPGLLQVKQRTYNFLHVMLRTKTRGLFNLIPLCSKKNFLMRNAFLEIKKTTFRNVRFLRYRW